MNIIWHSKSKQFHLYNDKISYIMGVTPVGSPVGESAVPPVPGSWVTGGRGVGEKALVGTETELLE